MDGQSWGVFRTVCLVGVARTYRSGHVSI
eukprot:SAG11_NODE_38551_length_251_cov_16.361842_1_plen_28_part_10